MVGMLLATIIPFTIRLGSNRWRCMLHGGVLLSVAHMMKHAERVMAGLVAGLVFYDAVHTIMVGVTVIICGVGDYRLYARTGVAWCMGIFLIAAGPCCWLHPDEYEGRLNVVGIFQSGWLTREVQLTGRSETDLLLDQFKRAVLAYNAYPDRTSWYGSPRPFFDGLWSILFILGLGYATLRPLDRRLFPMLIWWWGAIILGGMPPNPSASG
jgi:hypothetical protein